MTTREFHGSDRRATVGFDAEGHLNVALYATVDGAEDYVYGYVLGAQRGVLAARLARAWCAAAFWKRLVRRPVHPSAGAPPGTTYITTEADYDLPRARALNADLRRLGF